MHDAIVYSLMADTAKTILLLTVPILFSTMSVGLLVSIFQAATQINESTLVFVPKILIVILIFFLIGPWMMGVLTEYTTEAFKASLELLQ